MEFKKIFSLAVAIVLANFNSSISQIPLSKYPENTQTRSGNKQFEKENFAEAEAAYKKALDIKNNMPEATFNLGDAVYNQKRYNDAGKQFQLSAQTNSDENIKAKAYYNLGNTFLEQKKWEDAIKAYKSSLKINPADADTKYNLAYANAMLQNGGGGGNGNNNQDQKDQQDQQQQDQQKQQDQNKDQNNSDQSGQEQKEQDQKQQQKQNGQNPKMSKEDADKLLAAIANEEQKAAEKMQKEKMKAVKVKIKKDW